MLSGAPMRRAKTIVRTEAHRIQQASQEDARQLAKSKGANVVKQWNATLDGATRPTNKMLDGQIREVNEPFVIGTKKQCTPVNLVIRLKIATAAVWRSPGQGRLWMPMN